jgi:hypothetical protein
MGRTMANSAICPSGLLAGAIAFREQKGDIMKSFYKLALPVFVFTVVGAVTPCALHAQAATYHNAQRNNQVNNNASAPAPAAKAGGARTPGAAGAARTPGAAGAARTPGAAGGAAGASPVAGVPTHAPRTPGQGRTNQNGPDRGNNGSQNSNHPERDSASHTGARHSSPDRKANEQEHPPK